MVDVTGDIETETPCRLTGPGELALVEASGWQEWPPRLPGQPIFHPVLNEQHATMIARDWNAGTPAQATRPPSASGSPSWTAIRSTR